MTEPNIRQKATLWLATVFVLGAALGGVLGYAFAHRSYAAEPSVMTPEAKRAQKREQLKRDVGLTPDQQKQVAAILDQAQVEYKAVHDLMEPQIDAIRQKNRGKSMKSFCISSTTNANVTASKTSLQNSAGAIRHSHEKA